MNDRTKLPQSGSSWRRDGIFSGYPEYRYGSARPITLAGTLKRKPVLAVGKRKHVVSKIIEEMRDWRTTPFENEGPMRHAIRSALCLGGNAWTPSDDEAALIVSQALRILGAQRPKWEEGQPRCTDSPDFCSWCKRPLDLPAGLGKASQFCSPECAMMAIEKRNFEHRQNGDKAYAAARRALLRGRTKPRTCPECGATFRPVSEASTQECCSFRCSAIRKARAMPLREWTCRFCGSSFLSKAARADYCSNACWQTLSKMKKGRQPRVLKPHVFDHFLTMPANARPYPRPITPEMFDKLFGRAA